METDSEENNKVTHWLCNRGIGSLEKVNLNVRSYIKESSPPGSHYYRIILVRYNRSRFRDCDSSLGKLLIV
jgi:hypothetical protein